MNSKLGNRCNINRIDNFRSGVSHGGADNAAPNRGISCQQLRPQRPRLVTLAPFVNLRSFQNDDYSVRSWGSDAINYFAINFRSQDMKLRYVKVIVSDPAMLIVVVVVLNFLCVT